MRPIDAAPLKDFPREVIVLDSKVAERRANEAFYLRVQVNDEQIRAVRLTGEVTLPGARNAAVRLGYNPTHWLETRVGFPVMFD
ncbi:hypothetical protein C7401_15421 [Paraburkholderia unamae]|uniref:hypothetical protein n=1 Tax=Paraburkholderia unamae TaxID=219649 RepID=UPI000DC343EB|nr:hypothetical protein [Paraburkholderia unamae]RAR47980.1 hypothetical protein C7401_15421 [Paraburkholderia unamae]